MKLCSGCNQEKAFTEFHKRNDRPCGYKNYCKDCANERRKEYYNRDKESGALKEMIWRRAGINMTHEAYVKRYEELDGCCEICDTKCDVLCVDHNHETGEVRGLLCTPCNLAIENLQESVEVMRNAIKYIQKYGGRNVKDCA